MSWSEEQVIALSPDEASIKSGKDLAKAEKWASINQSTAALWGECKGSGSKPYQTRIDLNNIAFKCSCPSRKFPCKHGLGLLLLYAKSPIIFKESDPPEWVAEWLSKRAERDDKKSEKVDKPIDEVAQAKRQQARQSKVNDGIEELLIWIKDIIRNGLLSMPDKAPSYWENMSRRMIDAQAPGLGRMIHSLGNINFYQDHWQSNFLDQLTKIFLVLKGYQNISDLAPSLQEDIKSFLGITINQEELKEQVGITDKWVVLAKQNVEEGNLTTERYWLYGMESRQYALILQFIVNGQGKNLTLTPGMQIKAELVFFPSVVPLRAILKKQVANNEKVISSGFESWEEVSKEEARMNSLHPLLSDRPFIIEKVRPHLYKNKWVLVDSNNQIASIKDSFKLIYHLLAISGGNPLTLAVLGYENSYEPVGAWYNNKYYIL